MANDVTVHNGDAGIGTSFVAETYDTGSGHRQIVSVGGSGTTAFSDPTCDTTADLVLAANAERKSATIQNAGTVTVYLGPSGVSTTSGLVLEPGAVMVDNRSTSAWYGITASGTADLRVCEVA